MKRTVTVLGHRRSEYLSQTLAALAKCDGIEDWKVLIVLDRPNWEVSETVAASGWPWVEMGLGNHADPPYSRASRATLLTLSLAFADADYVAHLEEDVVPHPDFLTWHTDMSEQYQRWNEVFTISAWWQSGDYDRAISHGFAPHFTPWGWGTWRDRFDEMRGSWSMEFWDRHLNEVIRGDRLTVHPLVARVTDIGEYGGVNPPEEWRARQPKE